MLNFQITESAPANVPAIGHFKARHETPRGYPRRGAVPDCKVSWSTDFPLYSPVEFSAREITTKDRDGSDLSLQRFSERFSTDQFRSFEGRVHSDPSSQRPRNVRGRTGITGLGSLYFWGRNTAADQIVSRFNPEVHEHQVLLIQRKDDQWAFPGGFYRVNSETSFEAALRECSEETGVTSVQLRLAATEREKLVFEGYDDDGRNTDNAWIETSVWHQPVDFQKSQDWQVKGGDDAKDAAWVSLTDPRAKNLYAGHAHYLELIRPSLTEPTLKNENSLLPKSSFSAHRQRKLIHDFKELRELGISSVVFFGGSFDPIHSGHLDTAAVAQNQLRADAVLFMPAKRNPLKPNAPQASDDARLNMVSAVIEDFPGMLVSDWELRKDPHTPSYTIDAVRSLKSALPPSGKVFLLVGSDNIDTFDRWKNAQELGELATLVFQPRGEYTAAERTLLQEKADALGLKNRPIVLEGTTGRVSSTFIRRAFKEHRDISSYVLPQVLQLLRFKKSVRIITASV